MNLRRYNDKRRGELRKKRSLTLRQVDEAFKQDLIDFELSLKELPPSHQAVMTAIRNVSISMQQFAEGINKAFKKRSAV